LTLALYVEAVEVSYLTTNFQQASYLAEVVLERAQTVLDRVRVYETKIQFYIPQNQMQVALDTGLEVLEKLGCSIVKAVPQNPIVEDLYHLPLMTAPDKLAALRILVLMFPPAYQTNAELFKLITSTMVNLCIDYGNSPLAALAYVCYGGGLCNQLDGIDLGYKFGQLGLRLLDKFDSREIKCKVNNLFNGFIVHWKQHVKSAIAPVKTFNSK